MVPSGSRSWQRRVGTSRRWRIAIESGVSAVIAFLLSLVVFGPLLGELDSGWGGGDMISTYVNSANWSGFFYRVTDQFGFPLGMDLNYFPGIDVTENTFALLVDTVTGSMFLGINLLVLLSFPLVAALAYLAIRMTGLQGPLAIALAISFTFIPFHWGRALGHTYLSTLYSAVVGVALVLLVGSGSFERLVSFGSRRHRMLTYVAVAAMVATVAWTGVYYVAFTLILGAAAIVWRVAQRASVRALVIDVVPFLGIIVLSAIAFVPSILTVQSDPPLASLGERVPYESVVFAGNLALAVVPLPQSSLPGMDFYNRSVVEAFAAAPYSESTAITNHGTWITSAALLTMLIGLVVMSRRRTLRSAPAADSGAPVTLGLVAYLTIVVLLFFVPWGLNYLLAGTVTAQIRAWNRLLPLLLLLFLIGAAATLWRTRAATRLVIAVPIALVILGLTVVDTVYPFRSAYADSLSQAGSATRDGRDYAEQVNSVISDDCGVLQLPYIPYPEFGTLNELRDYEHFWPAITNPQKEWSYGSVRFTDASIWAAQLPQVPTAEQVDLLRAADFCGIHLDTRGYTSKQLGPIQDDLNRRFGAPVATAHDGEWQFYDIRSSDPTGAPPSNEVDAFFHQPFIENDPITTLPRDSALGDSWWWTTADQARFTFTPTSLDWPLQSVSGSVEAPSCGPRPTTLTLSAGDQSATTTVVARPGVQTEFRLTLPGPSSGPTTLSAYSPGKGCSADTPAHPQFLRVLNLAAR